MREFTSPVVSLITWMEVAGPFAAEPTKLTSLRTGYQGALESLGNLSLMLRLCVLTPENTFEELSRLTLSPSPPGASFSLRPNVLAAHWRP
jgi:hypothetical protein